MKVELLSYTANPERTIATAAKQCYSGVNAEEISGKMTDETVGKFVHKLANTGHTPVEHAPEERSEFIGKYKSFISRRWWM